MGEIKYGSIEYFGLIEIQSKLKWMERDCNKFGLLNYDKFLAEVDIKVEQIQYAHKHKNDCSECDGTGIIDNSYMTCLGCNGSGTKLTPSPLNKIKNK